MNEPRPRILLVDDDPAVLETYRRILTPAETDEDLAAARASFFDEQPAEPEFGPELVFADQGLAAVELVAAAAGENPFAMAFVDMRMPPGIDGVETIERLWAVDPDLQVVVASAYTDVPWDAVSQRFGLTDKLLFLKKPFDPIEARQLATALCRKHELMLEGRTRERELERRVIARTKELAQALTQSEDAGRARLQFLANMSHEIRTPLTAILGFAEMLRDPSLPESERHEQLAILERNSRHLLQLVNDVLDLSKLDAGQLLVESAPVDLPALLDEVVSSMRPQANGKGIALAVDPNGTCPANFSTDGRRLRQALINFVGNAVKFTREGSVTIRVGPPEGGDPALVEIGVADTGIGIPADRMPALFEPFVQADATTSRQFGGTGLGLSITRRLVHLLGGEVRVRSELGRGSEFTICLPTGEGATGAWVPTTRPNVARNAAPAALRDRLRGRVLLVEDGVDNQRLLAAILRRAGAEVELAVDGKHGVDSVMRAISAGKPFDLVLMDMQMPVMDGYQATQRLRELGWDRPIVALTAHAMAGDRERCMQVGCDGYETKPVEAARLIATCARFGLASDAAGPKQ